jgi:hypothetical protein
MELYGDIPLIEKNITYSVPRYIPKAYRKSYHSTWTDKLRADHRDATAEKDQKAIPKNRWTSTGKRT